MLNGGGVNCVLASASQPKSEVVETETKPTTPTEIKKQYLQIPSIEISSDMMDNFVVVGGVVLGLLLLSRFRK